jgi:hypothetical protein
MEENSFIDRIIEALKAWVRYFTIGIWSLLLFGILGFLIFTYAALKHIEMLEQNQETRVLSNENGKKGKITHAKH